VHHYRRNIGDYHKKAGRLSILQHGVYTLLIDACYDRERFPTKEDAIDWTWASSQEEIDAVGFVLTKFFSVGDDGVYVQNRIEEEIQEYHGLCLSNTINGKKGGRPKGSKNKQNKTHSVNNKTHSVNNKTQLNPSETQINPKPLTSNLQPLTIKKQKQKTSISIDFQITEKMRAWASKSVPGFDIDLELESWIDYWAGEGVKKADWVATWRNGMKSRSVKNYGINRAHTNSTQEQVF